MQLKTLILAAGAVASLALSAVVKLPVSTDVTVVEKSAWVRWLPNALPAAGYVTLKNSSDEPLDVTRVKTPDYKSVTIYKTVVDDESSRLVKVDKFTIPPHGEFSLVPGRYQLMFEKPTRLITPGDNARVIFFLSDGKVVKLRMPVRTGPYQLCLALPY